MPPQEPTEATPADISAARAKREADKRERRRQHRCSLPVDAIDYGREIPPRINPDIPDMIDQLKECYFVLTNTIALFRTEIDDLIKVKELRPKECDALQQHYSDLLTAIDAAESVTLSWSAQGTADDVMGSTNLVADSAKYVYAVGARDIATMQYRLSELACTGALSLEANERLQWAHCVHTWEVLYHGTVCAVRDERTWDGNWDWSDNTYSDGRQVMSQARLNNWIDIERNWPFNGRMAGDGACNEHPLGSICSIAPVHDADDYRAHEVVEFDFERFVARVGLEALLPFDENTLDDMALAVAIESLPFEPVPPGLLQQGH